MRKPKNNREETTQMLKKRENTIAKPMKMWKKDREHPPTKKKHAKLIPRPYDFIIFIIQDGAPKIAISCLISGFMVDITIVNGGVYKPTNISGGPHPV